MTERRQRWEALLLEPVVMASDKGGGGDEEANDTSLAAFKKAYELGGKLGAGGFASVHIATHRITGEKIAVKRLEGGSMGREEMKLEVEVLRALRHRHVVQMLGAYYPADLSEVFLLEELMSGGDLFEWMSERRFKNGERGRPLRHDEMARLCSEMLLGLQHMHSHGVLHRDIKPANLLMTTQADKASVRISDFGLCAVLSRPAVAVAAAAPEEPASGRPRAFTATAADREVERGRQQAERRLESRTTMVGTPEFMSPEMVMCAQVSAPPRFLRPHCPLPCPMPHSFCAFFTLTLCLFHPCVCSACAHGALPIHAPCVSALRPPDPSSRLAPRSTTPSATPSRRTCGLPAAWCLPC